MARLRTMYPTIWHNRYDVTYLILHRRRSACMMKRYMDYNFTYGHPTRQMCRAILFGHVLALCRVLRCASLCQPARPHKQPCCT